MISVDVTSSKNENSYFDKVPGRPIYIDAQATNPMVITNTFNYQQHRSV